MPDEAVVEEYFQSLSNILHDSKTKGSKLFQLIVDIPFIDKLHSTTLDLGIIVFLRLNTETKVIERVAYSDTEQGRAAVNASSVPFNKIQIPFDHPHNISARAIRYNKPFNTSDWSYLLTPALTTQSARFNQAESGIDCSYVYPMGDADNRIALIFSFYQPMDQIGKRHQLFMKRYCEIVSSILSK